MLLEGIFMLFAIYLYTFERSHDENLVFMWETIVAFICEFYILVCINSLYDKLKEQTLPVTSIPLTQV